MPLISCNTVMAKGQYSALTRPHSTRTRKKEREEGTLLFLAPSHESARALSKLQSLLTLDYE